MTTLIPISLDQIQLSPFRQGFSQPVPSPALLELARNAGVGALSKMRVRNLGDQQYELVTGIQVFLVANILQQFDHEVELVNFDDDTCRRLVALDYSGKSACQILALGRQIVEQAEIEGKTHVTIGRRYGLETKETSLYVRLTRLCPDVQAMLERGEITAGIGKLLVGLSPGDQVKMASLAVENAWTSRAAEQAVRELKNKPVRTSIVNTPKVQAAMSHIKDQEQRLSDAIGNPVEVIYNTQTHQGEIIIRFSNLDCYEGIAERLTGVKQVEDF